MRARAPIDHLSPGERLLSAETAHYLTRVLRLRAGDAFEAFDPLGGGAAEATVLRIDGEHVTVALGALRAAFPREERPIVWLQGLAKGDKCDAIVRDVTELGVSHFVAAQTARTVVRLDAARIESRLVRWRRIATEAARQSERAEAPEVRVASWSESLASVPSEYRRFILYERATEPLGPVLAAALGERTGIAFAVGPEGGLTDDEVREATLRGWLSLSLGPYILRTETVAAAVLGAVRVWSSTAPQ